MAEGISAWPAMKFFTKRGRRPVIERPSMSCAARTWPSVPLPAPIPLTGYAFQQQQGCAGGLQCTGVLQHGAGLVFLAALDLVAAQYVDRLRSQSHVRTHRNAVTRQGGNDVGQPAAAFQLDHMGAGL